MNETPTRPPVVFTPDNEPYLGRETVYAFDNLIVACLQLNSAIAPRTHLIKKNDLQWAACQIIPQGINIALSIRELVRQGYLFGALVLLRGLAERRVIILYPHENPDKVEIWNRGWKHGERPSLAAMLNTIGGTAWPGVEPEVTRQLNSIVHGDPDSAQFSLVRMGRGGVGHGVSKNLDDPNLCDKVCMEAAAWLSVLLGMMQAVFPDEKAT